MKKPFIFIYCTILLLCSPAVAENTRNDILSEGCIITYREIREELFALKSCVADSDCAPAFFTFPFGPDKCIFYGINNTEGKKARKAVEGRIEKFTNECSRDKSDYQQWLKQHNEGFKITPEDCVTGGMFANCENGRCVTKFGYENKDIMEELSAD